MNKALIVFLKVPELGKVKTRLAKDIGEELALETYKLLTEKTHQACSNSSFKVFPFFVPSIPENHIFLDGNKSFVQSGKDLGEAMFNAFRKVFSLGYQNVCIIGSDCWSISNSHLEKAFDSLEKNDVVFGPSKDGGYYLLGMNQLHPELFMEIDWSTERVLEQSIEKVKSSKIQLLEELNDIDNIEDLKQERDLWNLVLNEV